MSTKSAQKGMSLVEILVVMVIMGLVTTAVMTLYIDTQSQSTTSEEVADLQQNVRIALNEMVMDLRMAGLLIPSDTTAIANAPAAPATGDRLIFRTAAASRRVGRIGDTPGYSVSTSTTSSTAITMANAAMARSFSAGDRVRIFVPADAGQRVDEIFEVESVAGSAVTIKQVSAAATYFSGEAMVHVDPASPVPRQVAYFVENNQLRRAVDGGTPLVIADGITALQLTYLLEDGTSLATVPADQLDEITTIRIALVGQTDTPGGGKTRDLSTEVKIRNQG